MSKLTLKKPDNAVLSDDLLAQRRYTEKLRNSKFDFGLVFEEAFVRGMRDIGYKSTATAVNELIDNGIQAEATEIHVAFGYNPKNNSKKKPDMLAVVDDGHGMDPTMIRASVLWGGSHRADVDDRTGFGRYGYGLPSACVSMGQVYSVYSKTVDGEWHKVSIDLRAIGRGEMRNQNGHVVAPKAVSEVPPSWVNKYLEGRLDGMASCTVVVIEEIDRLSYTTTQKLKEFFLQTFGVTYKNYLREVSLFVESKQVEPIDQLFITEGNRFYDEDEDRAEALEPLFIEVKDRSTKDAAGVVKVRFSYMSPTFLRVPEDKLKPKGKNNNRFQIRKEYNGISVLRAGRLIDVVSTKCPWTTFQNNDRYVGVEVDFPPSLDEEFSITTSKQQVVLSQRIWDILENNGVYDAINQLRARYKKEAEAIKVKRSEKEGEKRRSEQVMEDVQELMRPRRESQEEKKRQAENLDKEAEKRSRDSGVPKETVKKELVLQAKGRPFKVEIIDHPGAPFYRVDQIGGQRVLFINQAHRFFSEVYNAPGMSLHGRSGLEVTLFVLGDCELRASPQVRAIYESERAEWSKYLGLVLDKLAVWENSTDAMASDMEQDEADAAAVDRKTSKTDVDEAA